MLVRFTSKASASVSMFEKDATSMLKMMGHSGTIPSAIRSQDVAARLHTLEEALKVAAEKEMPPKDFDDDEDEAPVPVNRRAYPLLELLRAAISGNEDVMWDYDHSVI